MFLAGKRADYPPFPENYFSVQSQAVLEEHCDQVMNASGKGEPAPEFPERLITTALDNTWHDSAEAVIDNWIGKVYQLTHVDRKKPFQDVIDPNDPLGLRAK